MPPRIARTYHVQVKTHKLTIMLSSLPPTTSIAEVKAETLSALQADVAADALDPLAMDPPELHIESVDDFELCRTVRSKGQPGEYEVLEPNKLLRDTGLGGWEAIFLQPRDQNTRELVPITYTLPSMYDEDEDPQPPMTTASRPSEDPEAAEVTNGNKGKRKAPPDEYDEVIQVEI